MGCVQSKTNDGPLPPHLLYCRPPEGVHSHMLEHVDLKKLSKLVKNGRLAPLYPHDVSNQEIEEECPICTVSYPSMNTASCCAARVCTECFVYHQTASDPPGKAQCPFCKNTPFAVRYLGSKPLEQLQQERKDEQIWRRVKQRRRQQQNTTVPDEHLAGTTTAAAAAAAAGGQNQQQQDQQAVSTQQQQRQQQQQDLESLLQQVLDQADHQHTWLDDLLQDDGTRRVEAINVYAGFHARTSSSAGGTGNQSDPLLLHGPALREAHEDHVPGVDAAGAAAALVPGGALSPQEGGDRSEHQQQEHQQRDAVQLVEWQLSELQQLLDTGMLPEYAVTELSGLQLEELDEILLEQAVLTSLHQAEEDLTQQQQQHEP